MSMFGGIKWFEWVIPIVGLNHALWNAYRDSVKPKIPGGPAATRRELTSEEGQPIPVLYGTHRIGANVIYFNGPYQPSAGVNKVRLILGLCEGPIAGIGKVWVGDTKYGSLGATPWTLQVGTRPQSPLAWMTSGFPTEALGYSGTANVASSAADCDAAGNFDVPNFEAQGLYSTGVDSDAGDARPSAIITDLLTSPYYGAEWSGTKLADMTIGTDGTTASSYVTYCEAMGFWLSVDIRDQASTLDHLSAILAATNSTTRRSSGKLVIVPLGDKAIGTYTPDLTIQAALTESDFLVAGDEDPVRVTVRSRRDTFNDFPVTFTDRTAGYEPRTVSNPEPADVAQFGVRRAGVIDMPSITRPSHATAISRILAQNSTRVRRTFAFTLPLKYVRLEPLDRVTLTVPLMGLNAAGVRITTIDETEFDGELSLSVTAEEWDLGIGHAIGYTPQAGSGAEIDANVSPGNANAPVLAQARSQFAGGKQRVFIGTSGGVNWGGCEVWTAWGTTPADSEYQKVGTITQPDTHGALSATFASGSDPDVTNTLAVTLTSGDVATSTTAQRDALATLCYVDGEWVSYATATGTAPAKSLTSFRRGVWGSTIGSHAATTPFLLLQPTTFRLEIDASRVGSTLNVKLLSFNRWSNALQTLASVSASTVAITTQPLTQAGDLADGSVTTPKVADGAVTGTKLSADAISTSDYEVDGSDNPTAGARMEANTAYTAWAADTAYTGAQKRKNGTLIYRCKTPGTSAGTSWGAYSAAITYTIGDIRYYSGRTYYSLHTGNISNTPSTSPTWWEDRGANTGPVDIGENVKDGTVVWSSYAPLRVSPTGLQIGKKLISESWFTRGEITVFQALGYDATSTPQWIMVGVNPAEKFPTMSWDAVNKVLTISVPGGSTQGVSGGAVLGCAQWIDASGAPGTYVLRIYNESVSTNSTNFDVELRNPSTGAIVDWTTVTACYFDITVMQWGATGWNLFG